MTRAFVLAAALATLAALAGWPWLHWATKPLATALLIAMVARHGGGYARAVTAGLALSLVGDVALMLPGDYFLPGLVAFLLAHLAYLRALTRGVPLAARPLTWALFAALAVGLMAVLWSGVPPGMRAPVAVYAAVLAAMGAQAVTRAQILATPAARLAALGGVLFMVSDTMLALNRFQGPVPLSPLWVLGTYYAAQFALARSALPNRPGRV